MKKYCLFMITLCCVTVSVAQLKSPEAFLGYPLGSRYTAHHQVVDYFLYVSKTMDTQCKLVQYGTTNEHRPLYLAFVSSDKNIANLEKIRVNNIQLVNNNTEANTNSPSIVWLSYNVHGNETSSTEAAMLTLYELLNTSNTQSKQWLQNTVVIIDPCLNPDGRERYVNWFNGIVGSQYNASLNAREHREPWPGGRTNHYNFDLNRDWAWQTQTESMSRIQQYQLWMPQIHVDFHEQGINQPYYFAPAAKPYHQAITKWQKDFQVIVGKNHAGYFDKNNWLYFTKETFDLFYPSYGDTYPLYNGAIGMTYEQGGGPAGGLAATTDEGDTLTLTDRIMHHFTTGMSTVETASKNNGLLMAAFQKYYKAANNGEVGTYKTYIIKTSDDDMPKIKSLLQLLQKNGISYGTTNPTNSNGFNYFTQKNESFSINKNDIVITAAQSKATLLNVLFEPNAILEDSATYDITAWALPYVYGVQCYATTQKLAVNNNTSTAFVPNSNNDVYGYVLKWQAVNSASTVAALFQKGIKLRYAEKDFDANGQSFKAGAIIILKKGNESFGNNLWPTVKNICDANEVKMFAVNSGMVDKGADFGSEAVHPIQAPRVALLTGENVNANAAGEVWHFFDNVLHYPITLINANNVNRINWSVIDVLIMPDGRYNFLNDKDDAKAFEQWIKNGGRVVALESAVAQLSKQEWSSIKAKKTDGDDDTNYVNKNSYDALVNYNDRERSAISNYTPGAIFKVAVDNSHPLMYGYPNFYYTLKMDDVVYEFVKEGGWNIGVIKKENAVAGFVGKKLAPKLKDGLLFSAQELGGGTVTYLTDNVMFRSFWENGKLMLCNAVFFVGQ
ncbi:M14 family metallopeptidase [Ferruginibacter yonginensis]|uniref:M14 family metallopeptidase n=1 Tax=Ferruginibacter yonginensis TaxID=1310416 RepID=A0ABV8QRR0_9BACT